MRAVALLLVVHLVATSLAMGVAPAPRDDGWDFLRERAAALGIDLADLTVVRTMTGVDGTVITETVDIADVLAMAAPGTASGSGTPDILIGQRIAHFRIDPACRLYDVTPIAAGLSMVTATHADGTHWNPSTGTTFGIDTASPDTPEAHEDTKIEAVGSFLIDEMVFNWGGNCVISFGFLLGDGVAWFDRESPI